MATRAAGPEHDSPGHDDPAHDSEHGRHGLTRLATQNAVRRQRRVWSGRVASWDHHGSAGLTAVTAAVLKAADLGPAAPAARAEARRER